MKRVFYVVGNWKMYKTSLEAIEYIKELIPLVKDALANVYLSVPFTSIAPASTFSKNTNIVIGAQNMNDVREGAFTGEIASLMLKEAGAEFVILGHSERRQLFGESDALIQRKVRRALQDDIQPILCVGETLEERDSGRMNEVLETQIATALDEIPKEEVSKLILAYEPVWAIGTSRAATSEMAEEAHCFCRKILQKLYGKKVSMEISILYGGSVNPENMLELIAQENVDGVLVGGASLDPITFAKIATTRVT